MGSEISFKSYEQRQGQLLPTFLDDALESSDPAFFIDEVIEGLDLEAFERRYSSLGMHAYAPRMLLKLWLYAATQGVYSGREVARKIPRDLGFRYLAGEGPYPDFRTLNRFRVRHREDFAVVLVQVVKLAQRSGLVKLGLVAVDGSKIRANTSRHKAMSYGRMKKEDERLRRRIEAILGEMDAVNEAEDAEHGDGDGGGGLPEELQDAAQRRAKIREAMKQLEEEKREKLEDRHQKSFADREAQMMKLGDGSYQYAYNTQAAVSEDGFIVATGVSRSPNDTDQLVPMTERARKTTGRKLGTLLADKGYLSEAGLKRMRRKRQACLVAVGREGKGEARWPRGRQTQRMHRLLRLPWARERYAKRKTQGERPFAEIKARMRFRSFALRGHAKTIGEWDLVSSAFNLLHLKRILDAQTA